MQERNLSWHNSVWGVLHKDFLCELRTRYAWNSLLMFALTTLSTISMTSTVAELSPPLTAMLLWVIIFFCAMAGLARSFVQEQESGTLFTLRQYGRGQAILVGKLLFNALLLQSVTVLLLPLFIILLNVEIHLWWQLFAVLFLGTLGIAAVSTLTALMVSSTNAKASLFTVITFPVLLPHYLNSVLVTGQILNDTPPEWLNFTFLFGYDVTIIAVASLLFDYIWYD